MFIIISQDNESMANNYHQILNKKQTQYLHPISFEKGLLVNTYYFCNFKLYSSKK